MPAETKSNQISFSQLLRSNYLLQGRMASTAKGRVGTQNNFHLNDYKMSFALEVYVATKLLTMK